MTSSRNPEDLEREIATLRDELAASRTRTRHLEQSEIQYRHTIEHSLGLICTHSLNGTLLSINPAAAKQLGYEPAEMLGMNIRHFLAEPVQHLFDDYINNLRRDGISRGLMRLCDRRGNEMVWLYRNVVIRQEGKSDYVLGHAQDVTDLKRTQERLVMAQRSLEACVVERTAALRAANEQLQAEQVSTQHAEGAIEQGGGSGYELLDSMPIGVEEIDATGRIVYANPALERLLGFAPGGLAGLRASELSGRGAAAYHGALLLPDPPPSPFVTTVISANGQGPAHLQVCWVRRRDDHGRQNGIVAYLTDLTAHQRAERAHAQATKEESLHVIATGTAHVMNDTFLRIVGSAELGRSGTDPDSSARRRFQDVLDAVNQSAEVAGKLIAYGGQPTQTKTRAEVRAMLVKWWAELENLCPGHVKLERNLVGEPPPCDLDAAQVREALRQLIINAVEAIGDKPGTIAVSAGSSNVEAELRRSYDRTGPVTEGPCVWLEVTDTGVGMDEFVRRRALDPFYSTKALGRGLGLSVVAGAVRSHEGGIRVTPRRAGGTVVRLFFPAVIT